MGHRANNHQQKRVKMLILGIGTNLGNRQKNLHQCRTALKKVFGPFFASRVYHSRPVDYLDQPCFYNQVLEFNRPPMPPTQILSVTSKIEIILGRNRANTTQAPKINKGPRIIDIDILFLGTSIHQGQGDPIIPHPRLFQRSFVVRPLKELPYFTHLTKYYEFPNTFTPDAFLTLDQPKYSC